MVDLYSLLKDKVKDLANALVNLPQSNVWVHEKAIYNLIGIKGGNYHGKREVLTFLLKGIQRGSFGNRQKKDYIPLGYSIPNISNDGEENDFNICYQQYGDYEEFASGTHDDNAISGKPRWFRVGDTVTDVKTQIEIVNALTGEAKGLAADVAKRRRTYYKRFVAGNDDDGGYRRHDVSDIIDNYEEIWSESVGAKSDTRMGAQRKYNLEDRERIEDVLRLMIVASDNCGKLEVKDGQIVPNNSLRRSRGDGIDARTPNPNPNPITPASAKPTAATQPTPKAIQFTPVVKASGRNIIDDALLFKNLKCTTNDGGYYPTKLKQLASLELLFHLYDKNLTLISTACEEDRVRAVTLVEKEMARLDVNLNQQIFNHHNLIKMSSQQISAAKTNIKNARKNAVESGMLFPTSDDCLLYEYLQDHEAVSRGRAVQTERNFQRGAHNAHQMQLTLSAAWILRHIIYTHNLPTKTALMLWGEYHVLILRKPIDPALLVCERTLWNHVHRLSYIDNALVTRQFQSFITSPTPHGFFRCFSLSSDDSKHHKQNRHVLFVSMNMNNDSNNIQAGYRHVTSSVNENKSSNALKNTDAIISMLGLHLAAHIGGGTNDNANDAQKEIEVTFNSIMEATQARGVPNYIRELRYINGVERRPIQYGDPYHIANLAVMWASVLAFGSTENGDHTQVHHRQLMMSIHSLHTDNKPLSQAYLNMVMQGTFVTYILKTMRERQQRWLVNQRNAQQTLDMFHIQTADGNSSLIEWALKFVNESRSDWKRRVGGEIATWLSMPSIILGLHFESELGNYFEEIYAWHCRPGPLNDRSGFRMLEIMDLYYGFEVPWWNEAVANPETKLPNTMKYLRENFHGDDLDFRLSQIMRGLKKGRDEMIKMSSRYMLRVPVMYLLLTHREHGGPFLRAVLAVLNANPVDGVVLIHDADKSSEWGDYGYGLADPDVKKWYDIICKHADDVVHFWQQFEMNKKCLLPDLKKLSKEVTIRPVEGETAPILTFKAEYPILFEKLEAVFGMMMSNSRLCEQCHGSHRHGLRVGTGMDAVDAQQHYAVIYGYMFKQERRQASVIGRPAKKRKVGLRHDHTKQQLAMASEQLINYLPQWEQQAEALLKEPNNGIPSLSDIDALGRRVQDKKNIQAEMDAVKKMAANLTREKMTVDAVREKAASINPSNDRIMRLGDARLESRQRISEISRNVFWKDEFELDGKRPHFRVIWMSAVQSFPRLRYFHRFHNNGVIVRTKGDTIKFIGQYLSMAKKATKLICDFCHGNSNNCNNPNFVPKRDRSFTQVDLLELLGFIRAVDISDSSAEIAESAALTCLSSFKKIDKHYTYTLDSDDGNDEAVNEEVARTDEREDDDELEVGDGLRRSKRRKRRSNVRLLYPGEEPSMDDESDDEESDDEDDDEDDDAPVPFA